MYACPNGNASTQDCFVRNPLTMVRDLKYNGPRDSNYPERGYVGSPNSETFRFRYRLPRGVTGNQVMLQWRYVTANSCLPRGYRNNSELIRRGWVKTQLGDCNFPLNWTGQGLPEQFFNCAEVSIGGGGNPSPTPPAPTPVSGGGTCGNGQRGNGKCPNSSECCSEWGWCGTSVDHCKNNPSPTPPSNGGGTCGNGQRGNGECSNSNECCSEWGWCGTSEEHCGKGDKKNCCSWWNDECGSDAWCNENQNHCENYCNGKYV